jgi:hypothetical protein
MVTRSQASKTCRPTHARSCSLAGTAAVGAAAAPKLAPGMQNNSPHSSATGRLCITSTSTSTQPVGARYQDRVPGLARHVTTKDEAT